MPDPSRPASAFLAARPDPVAAARGGLPPEPSSLRPLRTVLLMFATAAVIVLWAALYARATLQEVTQLTDQRGASYRGRLLLVETFSLFKDVESGARGYFITGREDYLAPYHAARDQLPGMLTQLELLLPDLPAPLDWAQLRSLARQRQDLAALVVQERRAWKQTNELDDDILDDGKLVMDQIRAAYTLIDERQQLRIRDYTQAVTDARARADLWGGVSAGLSTVLFAVALVLLLREYRRRLQLGEALARTNSDLDQKVRERTVELALAHERLANFALEQDRAVEVERRRLAREVHDQIGQVLTAIKLIAASVPDSAWPPGQQDGLARALELGIASSRRITAELRPPLLDDLGLGPALQHLGTQMTQLGGPACHIDVSDADQLDSYQALSLFRIVQEALTNVQRHAQARQVEVLAWAQAGEYLLRISDDGLGLPDSPPRPGALGLTGMRERAALLGGRCEVGQNPSGGVRIDIRIPLSPRTPDHASAAA